MTSGEPSRYGLFGKIPALGDFVRANLAESFVGPWDRWMQDGIAGARTHLGARWSDAYLSAPIWRFTLAPGLAGANAALGVVMPSVDRVGRQFPLTLATPCPGSASPFIDHFASVAVFEMLEDLALAVLDRELGRDEILAELGTVPPVVGRKTPRLNRAQGTLVVRDSEDAVRDIAAGSIAGAFRAASIWSCRVGPRDHLMVCEGLPRSGQMTGLFDLAAPVWHEMEEA